MFSFSNFGTIQNNTALKPEGEWSHHSKDFGTIQNNTALKPKNDILCSDGQFWNHSEQHSSKTPQLR